MNRVKLLRLPAMFVAISLLTACASMSPTPENLLEDRAQARWDLLLSGDYAGAYEYLSPGYRSGMSLEQWRRKIVGQQVKWEKASVSSVQCEEGGPCKVTVRIDYALYGALPGVGKFESVTDGVETWVVSGGKWFYLPES